MKVIYALPIYGVFISLLLFIIIWTFIYTKIMATYLKLFTNLNKLLLLVSSCTILYITIMSRNISVCEINFIPFYSFIKAKIQPEIYRSMFMNIVLFVPIGIFMPFSFKDRSNKNIYLTLIFALLLSILIEAAQYVLGLGYSEIDDVIMNFLGAFIGSLSYIVSRFIELRKPED